MLTVNITKRLEVPGETGQWIEIRKVGWRKLREAADEHSKAAYHYVRVLGKDGIEAVKAVTEEQIKDYKATATAQLDPGVLLRSAVIAWSYSEDKPPKPDQLDELDTATAEWLVKEIVALAKPPRDEATSKNDSSSSVTT